VVTPVIAALAGAEVTALTAESRHGSVEDVTAATRALAESVGVADRITITTERTPELFAKADIITNSGHVRPIVGEFADAIRPDAVIPLMFETWEIRLGRIDVDLDDLLARGVRIGGTNERHPNVDIFSHLGPMAVAQLGDAGVSSYRGHIAILCDNVFRDFLAEGLSGAGADVIAASSASEILDRSQRPFDAILVAMMPIGRPAITGVELQQIADIWPDVVLVQYWGDLDRDACDALGLNYWPPVSPGAGHMGVLPSRVGPEPVVRVQTGGLKVGQVLHQEPSARSVADLRYVDEQL
jgi:CheY-like chemotaxis protein